MSGCPQAGESPLHTAAQGSGDLIQLVNILLDNAASLDALDNVRQSRRRRVRDALRGMKRARGQSARAIVRDEEGARVCSDVLTERRTITRRCTLRVGQEIARLRCF